MKKEHAIAFFDGKVSLLASVFDPPLSAQAIGNWDDVPALRQVQLEILTQGALKADAGIIPDYYVKKEKIGNRWRFVRIQR